MGPDIAVDVDLDRVLIRPRDDPSLVGVERCVGLVLMSTSSSGSNFRLLRNAGPSFRNSDGVEERLRLRWRMHVGVPSRRVGERGGVDEDEGRV